MKNTDGFKITVTNKQKSDDMSDTVTETGGGTYRKSESASYISYTVDNTRVLIKAHGNMISVKRIGDFSYDVKYESGKHTSFDYKTPYGTIGMSVFTERIICSTNENGGEIRLCYTLQTGGDKLYNDTMIKIER